MSIYDNKTKIYLDLNPTALREPQTYQLKKLTKIEAYLLDQIQLCERIAKKMKRFNTITGILDICLITLIVITGEIYFAAFASGVGLPFGIALSGTGILLSLAQVITRKSFKTFNVKQENMISLSYLPRAS